MEIMYGCTGTCNHPAPCNFAVVNIKVKQNVVRRFNREKVTVKGVPNCFCETRWNTQGRYAEKHEKSGWRARGLQMG